MLAEPWGVLWHAWPKAHHDATSPGSPLRWGFSLEPPQLGAAPCPKISDLGVGTLCCPNSETSVLILRDAVS